MSALPESSVVGEFVIDQFLGQGGFGITYRCHHRDTHSSDVIKEFFPYEQVKRSPSGSVVLKSKTQANEIEFNEGLDRFLREAKSLQTLTWPNAHPNIIQIKHFFKANNTAYFVMPFVEGKPLDIAANETFWSELDLATLLSEILSGLTYLHQSSIIHRDIKPANIYIQNSGKPVLLDFGAAIKSNTTGNTGILTEFYAPIEQYDPNGNQGQWTDIYALGVSFYKIITGKLPPDARSRAAGIGSMQPIVSFAKNRFNTDFLETIDIALQIKPEERWQSAQQWQKSLEPIFARSKNSAILGIFSRVNKSAKRNANVPLTKLLAAFHKVYRTKPVILQILAHLRTFGMTAILTETIPPNKDEAVRISLLEDQTVQTVAPGSPNHSSEISLTNAAIARIEGFFRARGVADPSRNEHGFWGVSKQSVDGLISIDEADEPTVMVQIPLFALESPRDPGLMSMVLEINADLDGPPRFSIKDDWLVVMARASVKFLQDDAELEVLINQSFGIAIEFGRYLENIANQQSQLVRQKQPEPASNQEPGVQADAESAAIVALLRLALREAAIAEAASHGTVRVNAAGEALLAESDELRAGFIDFSNQQETQASLKPGNWLDQPLDQLGVISRITEQAVLDTDENITVSRHKRGFSFFSLNSTIEGQAFNRFMQDKLEMLQPGARTNNLFTWFQVFMDHCKESRVAFISSYSPSKAIREIASRHQVTLVHYPIDKLPATLLDSAREFAVRLVNENPSVKVWDEISPKPEDPIAEPKVVERPEPDSLLPNANQGHKVWNEENFFEYAASKLEKSQLAALWKIYDECRSNELEIKWGNGIENGSFNVREISIIRNKSLFTIYTSGRLTLSLAGLQGTVIAEMVRDELYAVITGKHLLIIPDDYAKKSPGYEAKAWMPVAEPLIKVITEVIEKYRRK